MWQRFLIILTFLLLTAPLAQAAPTVPTGLTATPSGATQINLSWTASTDIVGVTAYKVYRGGVLLATLGNVTSYSDTGLAAVTAYSYTASACDAAGNCSAQSSTVLATTGAVIPTQSSACSGTAKYLSGISIPGSAAKKAGESLDVNYCLKNFGKVSRFDIYVAVELPDHTLLYMKSGDFFGTPIFSASVTPYLRNTLVPDLSGLVLSMPELPLELPLGSYTFYAVPVLTGKPVTNTANWIGQISKVSFTLSW